MATVFLPLERVRVVDVTSSLAGPYCTEILGARRQPPRLGEHTDEILHELGNADAELETLAADGAIRRIESNA